MTGEIYIIIPAVIIDILIGDPEFLLHPVIIIGFLVSWLETGSRTIVRTSHGEIVAGIIVVCLVILCTYIVTWGIIKLLMMINFYLGLLVNIWLFSTTIAIKGLSQEGFKIYNYLKKRNIYEARQQVSRIVGRETDNMDASDVIRAAVESIAENTSDGIIAPLFFFFIGGTPLAMTYKAVNTMDSMLGHKNKKYLNFGRAAARFDDIVNYIPARITALMFCLAALLNGYDYKNSFNIIKRDAGKHPSVNAGYPEAAVAGALGIRLGGINHYHGKADFRAYMGDEVKKIDKKDIKKAVYLLYWNTGLVILIFILLSLL